MSEPVPAPELQCEFCPERFQSKRAWKDHNTLSHDTLAFVCDFCPAFFYDDGEYIRHYQTRHRSEFSARHTCDVCGVSYKYHRFLQSHIESKHRVERVRTCDKCGEEFCNTVAYNLHVKLKHVRRRKFHKCTECRRRFTSKDVLRLHQKFDHNPNGKKYFKQYCHDNLDLNDELKQLLKNSKTVTKCKCTACSVRFSTAIDLFKHFKAVHSMKKYFQCCQCDDTKYVTRSGMGIHLTYEHGISRQHKCVVCTTGHHKPPAPKTVAADDFIEESNAPPWSILYVSGEIPQNMDLTDATDKEIENLRKNIRSMFHVLSTIPPSTLRGEPKSNSIIASIQSMKAAQMKPVGLKNIQPKTVNFSQDENTESEKIISKGSERKVLGMDRKQEKLYTFECGECKVRFISSNALNIHTGTSHSKPASNSVGRKKQAKKSTKGFSKDVMCVTEDCPTKNDMNALSKDVMCVIEDCPTKNDMNASSKDVMCVIEDCPTKIDMNASTRSLGFREDVMCVIEDYPTNIDMNASTQSLGCSKDVICVIEDCRTKIDMSASTQSLAFSNDVMSVIEDCPTKIDMNASTQSFDLSNSDTDEVTIVIEVLDEAGPVDCTDMFDTPEPQIAQENTQCKCNLCETQLEDQLSLLNHMTEAHPRLIGENLDTELFKCLVCGLGFRGEGELNGHMKLHFDISKKFDSRHDLTQSDTSPNATQPDPNLKHECSTCQKAFSDLRGLYLHHLRAHGMKTVYPCVKCNTEFTDKRKLIKHKVHCNVKQTSKVKEVVDKENSTNSNVDLKLTDQQVMKEMKRKLLLMCKKEMQQKQRPDEKRIHKCLKCESKFAKRQLLLQHIRNEHNVHLNKIYKCSMCNSVFKMGDKLKQHMKLKHDVGKQRNIPLIKINKSKMSPVKLDNGKLPTSISNILSKNLLNGSMHSCKMCNSYFPSNELLQRHIQWEHTKNVNLHKCGQCHEVLYTVEDLELHMSNAHNTFKWKKQIASTYEQQTDI